MVAICFTQEQFNDEDCGVKKGCVFAPKDCTSDGSCLINFTYRMVGSKLEMEISGKVTNKEEYAVVGLSKDESMGNDLLICCINSGKKVFASLAMHRARKRTEFLDPKGLEVIKAHSKDDRLYCKIRQTRAKFENQSFSLSEPYYILLAVGSYRNNTFQYHTRWNSYIMPKVSLREFGEEGSAPLSFIRSISVPNPSSHFSYVTEYYNTIHRFDLPNYTEVSEEEQGAVLEVNMTTKTEKAAQTASNAIMLIIVMATTVFQYSM
ncbi:hypothetical protein Y032_0015g2578 [Ancylostoma ceylanicum]|nr:hypothetical protein Y032_0015g2578 [Ancylostoma ceylanicum]